uniref:Translocon at the inner envelope membrane of chloroplasts 214 n=1 Tax=Tmesipteris elongata TaxID=50272 RepID=A0A059U410_TMEEL|nr:hypothetical protein [Tmesipteris elongata]
MIGQLYMKKLKNLLLFISSLCPVFPWLSQISLVMPFGLYYGFLTTLPIGPSQILSIRSFLLEGNRSGIICIFGSMMGQFIILLSIYCSPLYVMLIKPHLMTLLVIPYMLYYWYRTKDPSKYEILRPINSLTNAKISYLFLNSFVFQLLNPIILPSPVLTRLINLFIFRYSNNVLFLISSFLGWLCGHILFINSIKFLLFRIEHDSPIIYILMKRKIYRTFSILISITFFLYMGRSPLPLVTKKFADEITLSDRTLKGTLWEQSLWLYRPWPTSFFDQYRWNRPVRYIANSQSSHNGFVKKQVSDFFYDECIADGKNAISFASQPSLSIFKKLLRNDIKNSDISTSTKDSYKEWIDKKREKRDALNNEFKDRIQFVSNSSTIREVMEKKTEFFNDSDDFLVKVNDPLGNKSSWLFSNLKDSTDQTMKMSKNKKRKYTRNKIRNWILNKQKKLKHNQFPLLWEPISKRAEKIFWRILNESEKPNIIEMLTTLNSIKNNNSKFRITWKHVLQLPSIEKNIFLIHLKRQIKYSISRYPSNLSLNDLNLFNIFTKSKDLIYSAKTTVLPILKIEEMQKELPRYNSRLRFDRVDAINVDGDIRQRKLKNLGPRKEKEKEKAAQKEEGKKEIEKEIEKERVIKRFQNQSDFRRRLVKGSMRARRRKTGIWRFYQSEIHSPFFLRMKEIPISFQPSLNALRFNKMKDERAITGIEKELRPLNLSYKRSKADRLAIAARYDFPIAQGGRGVLLIIQSNLRKYVILPILIIVKNISRIMLFQSPEWKEDWTEWEQEIHIKCTYDGIEVSDTELPAHWFKEGLQIKILYPFHLRPWHIHRTNQLNDFQDEVKIQKEISYSAKQRKFSVSYLTIWGYQTNSIFGNLKKQPSFWRPIAKKLRKKLQKNLFSKLIPISNIFSEIISVSKAFIISGKYNNITEKIIESNELKCDALDYELIQNYSTSTSNEINDYAVMSEIPIKRNYRNSKDILHEFQDQSEEDFNNIHSFNDIEAFLTDRSGTSVEQSYLDRIETYLKSNKKDHRYSINIRLIWKKQLVQTQQEFSRFRRKIMQLMHRWSLLAKRILTKLDREIFGRLTFSIQFSIQLILRLTKNITRIPDKDKTHQKVNLIKNNEQDLQISNRNTPVLSQAYVFQKLWHARTITKMDLHYLVQSLEREILDSIGNNKLEASNLKDWKWNEQNYLHDHIKDLLERQGLLKETKTFTEKNWNEWLHCFTRYQLPSKLESEIAPQKWRIEVKKRWNSKKNKLAKNKEYNLFEKENKYSLYQKNNLLKQRISNINKYCEFYNLLYSFIDSTKAPDIKKWSIQQHGKEDQIQYSHYINKRHKLIPLNSQNKSKKPWFKSISTEKDDVDSNLMLWVIPNPLDTQTEHEIESVHEPKMDLPQSQNTDSLRKEKPKLNANKLNSGTKEPISDTTKPTSSTKEPISDTKETTSGTKEPISDQTNTKEPTSDTKEPTSDTEEYTSDITSDNQYENKTKLVKEKSIREIKNHRPIPQLKWKSKLLEKKMQRLNNLISLLSVIEDQKNMENSIIPFCVKIGIDINLLNSFFTSNEDELAIQLCANSAHRLPRLLNDQNLMHKMVNILLKLEKQFEERITSKISSQSISKIYRTEKQDSINSYNLENIMLSRRYRELRILNSLILDKQYAESDYWIDKSDKYPNFNFLSQVQIIKRFLWPTYRLEDLACMNRFWFNTNNGSRFAMLKLRMYRPN